MMAENFNIMRDPKKGQNAIFWPSVADAKAGDDPTTVVVTMKNPFTAFPETLATENSMPVNLRKREELGDDFGVTETDGTGPFTQTTFKPGTEVTVPSGPTTPGSGIPWVKNKGAAYLDGIKWVPILEVGNRANEIETGGVNVVKNPAPQDVDAPQGQPRPRHHRVPGAGQLLDLELNHANTDLGFDDLRVRQAHLGRHRPRGPRAVAVLRPRRGHLRADRAELQVVRAPASSSSTSSTWTRRSRCSRRPAGRRARAASARRPARSSPGSTSTTAASRPRRRSTRPSSRCSRTSARR